MEDVKHSKKSASRWWKSYILVFTLGSLLGALTGMPTKTLLKLFKQIFSDANVIDVDFSVWDKSISLIVVADHVDSPAVPVLPVFAVDFIAVHIFNCAFHHIGFEYAKGSRRLQRSRH